jgi:ribosomal protein S18 acetylase RimI-like enzyme
MHDVLSAVTELPDSRRATIATLVAAFEADAAVRVLYPADTDYFRHFPCFLEAFGGRAFDSGVVDRDPARLAAALWFPPGLEPDGEAIISVLAATMPPDRFETFAAGRELQARMHPHQPHWYLPWIGVHPDAQGMGLGAQLLGLGLARADAAGMPAYLEATNRRNAALYARHGFEIVGVVESPDYPEIIPMWRPARAG